MSNDIPVDAVRRKSSRAAFITAAGFIIIAAAIGYSIWQISVLERQRQSLLTARDELTAQVQQLESAKSTASVTLNTIIQARDLILAGTPAGLTQASEVLNGVLRDNPNDAAVQSMLAEIAYRQNNVNDAIELMREALADGDNLLDYRVRLITYLCASGSQTNLSEARALLNEGDTPALLSQDARLGAENSAFTSACTPLGFDLINAITPDNFVEHVSESTRGDQQENPFAVRQVFLHIRSEQDRARAMEIAERVCAAGYGMPGIQVVAEPRPYPETGSVRFYYPVQEDQAAEIRQIIAGSAQQRSVAAWAALPDPRVLSGFSDLPGDRVEVWLPPLSAEASTTSTQARRGYACTALSRVSQHIADLTSEDTTRRRGARAALAQALMQHNDARMNAALIDSMQTSNATSRYQVQLGGAGALTTMGQSGVIAMQDRTRALRQLREMRAAADDPTLQRDLDSAITAVAAQ